jgi:molybdopterin/thiamine biosynthesis adenylyltransferase
MTSSTEKKKKLREKEGAEMSRDKRPRSLQSRERRVVVIGLGGIGSWVLQALSPYLNYAGDGATWTLVLVDGDEYEEKNRTRQVFDELGPKAGIQAGWVARKFPRLRVQSINQYLSDDGAENTCPVIDAIRSGDTVFSCLDNHKTRKMVADHCACLRDVTLISGGNEYTDGNIQVFVRRNGQNKTVRPEKYHPEMAQPGDKAPYELSCEALAASAPQLIFANLAAASLMLNAFYALEQKRFELAKPEVYFDVVACAATPRERRK